MALRTRIIRLESPSATQNVRNNMRDDIFMPMDGYSYGIGDKIAEKIQNKIDEEGGIEKIKATDEQKKQALGLVDKKDKKGFWASLFGTKEERQANRERRRKNRAERKAARRLRKSNRQLKVETSAKERALKLGKSQAEAQAAANAVGLQQKALEEQLIAQAEEKAKAAALAKGLTQQQAEDAANAAGGLVEDKIFGDGYGTDGAKDETKFWGSMSTGAKVALIGGGVVVLGLITWGIVASNKNK